MFTTDQVRKLARESGDKQQWHSDGRSLYVVTKNGRGFWVLHFRDPREGGAIRNTGLGAVDDVTPAAARRRRDDIMADLRNGRPVAIMTRKARGDLFSTAADAYLSNHADEWGERTRKANMALVANKVPADFKAKAVTAITADDIAEVLKPIWKGPGNNKGSRLRRLIQGTLASKDIDPNPARWGKDGTLREKLSKKRAETVNHPSMPHADVPAFMATLQKRIDEAKQEGDSIEDRAGRFVILTAVRRKEALAAKWGEFDLAARVWTVPAERMKKKQIHVVPLSQAALDALGTPGKADDYVFTNQAGGPLNNSHAALDKTWVPAPYVLHGFRTSMSTWAEEQDDGRRFPTKVIDAALAHAKKDAEGKRNEVTAAYLRSTFFEARKPLMEAWAAYATRPLGT